MEVPRIYEETQNNQEGIVNWADLMTPEECRRGQYYATQYQLRQSEISTNKDLWDRLIELSACQREPYADDPDYPNNFISLIAPCVEGQVASIIEGDIEYSHVTDNPAHKDYMVQYDAASEYARLKNRSIDHFKDFTRQAILLGNAVISPSWEKGLSIVKGKPTGFPRVSVLPLMSVLVDGRIKNALDLQYAEYIIHEIGFQSIAWARDEYGDEKANALALGYARYEGEHPDISVDDNHTFTLLHVWTRSNPQHNLQLIEMDANGLILRQSDPSKPYYKYVNNEYPFYFTRMIPVVGQFYGYGDGMLLKGLQELQNNLADECELAARFSAQSKIIVDPRAKMGADQLTSNPAEVAIATNPNEYIRVIQGSGINPLVPQMMNDNEMRAQRITRFNDIMTGNQQGVSATATQINSQMMQGSVGINDKKSEIARAMEWVDRYSLKLCMEYWDKPFWSTLGYNYSQKNVFVDNKEMLQAPSAVPVGKSKLTGGIKEFMGGIFGKSKVKEDLARDSKGELIYTDIDFDSKVYIGKGLNKNSTSLFNILNSLAGTLLTYPDGHREQAIDPELYIPAMEQLVGMKLRDTEGKMNLPSAQFDQASITGQNPIGNPNVVQKPQQTPENLMNTVPQVAGGDSRGLI